jgi:hypothetical protein
LTGGGQPGGDFAPIPWRPAADQRQFTVLQFLVLASLTSLLLVPAQFLRPTVYSGALGLLSLTALAYFLWRKPTAAVAFLALGILIALYVTALVLAGMAS